MQPRSAFVNALVTDTRATRRRLDPHAVLAATHTDHTAAAAHATLRRAYGGLLPAGQAASVLACLGYVDAAGARYDAPAVRVAAMLLVRLSLRPTTAPVPLEIDPMS